MSDITEFLLARIDEDERHARKLAETDRRPVLSLATTINHPQRLLAECEAKLRIVNYFAHEVEKLRDPRIAQAATEPEWWLMAAGRDTLYALASVYADHDDYREEWKTLTQR